MSQEQPYKTANGWLMLLAWLLLLVASATAFVLSLVYLSQSGSQAYAYVLFSSLLGSVFTAVAAIIGFVGLFPLQPNQSMVLTLAGAYQGTVRASGFAWVNPFLTRLPISLRARTLEANMLKVNDRQGNPIEISAVVVWRVKDTAAAAFTVDNFVEYVRIQAESSLRLLASHYAYDHGEEHEVTLRNGMDEVAKTLQDQLQTKLSSAGLEVLDARLTHLAYAPEIAGAMLRRQQAEAVIAARKMIVHGAVTMVEMALHDLTERHVVELDPERKASMVSNLLVVLCSESQAHPVINAGTLYQ